MIWNSAKLIPEIVPIGLLDLESQLYNVNVGNTIMHKIPNSDEKTDESRGRSVEEII